jgi:hypothetical protein
MKPQSELIVKIVQSIIANEMASFFNNELVPTKFHKQDLKFALNKLQPILKKNGKIEFDRLFEGNETNTTELFDVLFELTIKISSLGLHHCQNICEIVKAYEIDPNKIQDVIYEINTQ